MGLLVSSNEFESSIKVSNYFIDSSFLVYKEQYYYYFIGEVYSVDVYELIDILIKKDTDRAREVIGDFSLIIFDKQSDEILFFNDKSGRNIVYYSTKNGITISNEFWSVVRHDGYTLQDIDSIELKTQLFFNASTTYKSILSGLNYFENAVIVSINSSSFDIEKYWLFKFDRNELSIGEKYDALNFALERTFQIIKEKHPEDTVYGIGVSGGMDSRIIPFYAKKLGMELKSFIIGEEKPNKYLKSNDHYSSDLVVNYFNLEHQKLEFNELSYNKKNQIDCNNAPHISSQIFKIPNVNKCDFDVLLTGASGFIVGSSPFYSKNHKFDLIDTIFIQQSDLKLKPYQYKLKKGVNYLFGNVFNIQEKLVTEIDGVINEKEIEQIKENCENYLSSLSEINNTEKLMNYAISVLGQRNKAGAFESLLNQKKSYTPYTPFLINIVETWNEDDIYDRKIFENFIRDRLPELADIRQQNHKVAVSNRAPNIFQKIFSLLVYVIRGQGVMNYSNWAKKKDFQKFLKDELNNYSPISDYLNVNVIRDLVIKNKLSADVLANCIKINRILYLISEQSTH